LAAAAANHPEPSERAMGKLFFNIGVFAVVTFLIYLTCLWFIRIEERRAERRSRGS
jgi:hypothetical protein